MKKIYLIAFFSLFLLLSFFSFSLAKNININSSNIDNNTKLEEKKNYVDNQILVMYKENEVDFKSSKNRTFSSSDNESGIKIKEEFNNINATLYEITDDKTVEEKISELKNDSNVLYAEPNYKKELFDIGTNDTHGDLLWALNNDGQNVNNTSGTSDADIDWPEAMSLITSSSTNPVIVAIIDTGVAYNHPDLINKMWDGTNCLDENGDYLGNCLHGYDYANNNNDPSPNNSNLNSSNITHGTHIAGTIAAEINNNIGVAGIASNTKIMALEFDLTIASEIKAIDFAIENGAKIINASYGGADNSSIEESAISRFAEAGGLFITAAGNDSLNNDLSNTYPANYSLDNIISVAATGQNDELASFSNYGINNVDIAAPGVNILSTVIVNSYYEESFNDSEIPSLPNDYNSIENWQTASSTEEESNIVLFTDNSYPYASNSTSTATSEIIDLSSLTSANMSFYTGCDTEYSTSEFFDYVILEAVSESLGTSTEITRWTEASIDSSTNESGWAYNNLSELNIPKEFLVNDFQFQFRWITNGTNNNYGGCFIDNIEIEMIDDGSSARYGYMNGTSMATPHVVGLAALIWEYEESLSASKVKEIILNTGDSLSSLEGKILSEKRINAFSALSSIDIINPTFELELSNNNKNLKEDDELLITANFNEDISEDSNVLLITTGSNVSTSTMERINSTTYTYNHIVLNGNGTSTITLSGAKDLFANEIIEQATINNEFFVDNISPEKPIIETIPEKINYISSSSITISGTADENTLVYIELEKDSNIATSSFQLGLASSTFSFTFNLSLSSDDYLDDGEIIVNISSSDEAGNTSHATSTAFYKDTVLPSIISVESLDKNNNGKIDTLKLNFNKNIIDNLASTSDFVFTDYLINNLSTSSPDIANDSIWYFDIQENDFYDSGATSTLIYTKGNICDEFNNCLNDTNIVSVDKISPILEKLGDGSSDYTIPASSSINILFSEIISSSSMDFIENQIKKGADNDNFTFIWNNNNLEINTEENDIIFNNDVIIDLEDKNLNRNLKITTIDSLLNDYQTTLDSENEIILNLIINEAVINYPFENINIFVNNFISNTNINLSSLVLNNEGLLPQIIILSTNINNIETKIPSSTIITFSNNSWDNKLIPPHTTNFTLPDKSGYKRELDLAIALGSDQTDILFNKAIRIKFPNKAGTHIAYSDSETSFTEITNICSSDSISTIAEPCKINIDSDLIIYTNHFSSFALFSETKIIISSGGGGGGGGSYYTPIETIEIEEEIEDLEIIEDEISTTSEETIEEFIEEEDIIEVIEQSDNEKSFIEIEQSLLSNIDTKLSQRLSGRILLQIEEHGEAWYINPLNNNKYYLGRPLDAFNIMRALGLGISNKDFYTFNNYAPERLSGRILLKVDDLGKAYYVDPLTLKMRYLGRPDDAFSLMREMGLGITNENLRKINISSLDK